MIVVVIIGASGYIGKHLIAELLRIGGHEVRVLSRRMQQDQVESKFDSRVQVVEGDINDLSSLQLLLKPGCIVINLVYLWGAGEAANLGVVQNLLNACSVVRVSRLIHCSTAAVVGRSRDNPITEQSPCHPITEYGITKLKVEHAIAESLQGHFDAVILRPTSVFGIGAEPIRKLANDLLHGNRWRNYAKSCLFGNRRMNLVHINNVVASIIFLIRPVNQFDGKVFIVSDDDAPNNNFAAVEQRLIQIFDVASYPLPRFRLPLVVLSILLTLMGRNNVNPRCNYAPDNLLSLGFERPVTFDEGLTEYAAWYRSIYRGSGQANS